jgi:aminopeptidase N
MRKPKWMLLAAGALFVLSCQRPAPAPGISFADKIAQFPDPVAYDLKLDIDYDSGVLSGVCKIALKNPGPGPVSIVPLNLYRLMEVTSVTDDSGKSLEFAQRVCIFEDWRVLQVNHIRIRLNPPLSAGKSAALTIRYGGPLLGYAEAMRYVKDHIDKEMTLIRTDSLAIPEIAVPSWRTNRARGLKSHGYTVSVTAPSGLVVANGGNLISKTEANGKTTTVYTSRVPSWRMDFAISNYEILEGAEGRFRIFAFPADREGAVGLLKRLDEAMGLYTQWFGPLKTFRGLTVIEIPDGYGSQADAAAIIQEASAVKDRTKRVTFYHELSHLWNVDGKDPLPCRFESEGLAMFLQHLVEEKLEGKAGAIEEAVSSTLAGMRKTFAAHPDWKGVAMIDYGEKDLTDLSYRVGQIAFYLLYKSLGKKAFLETIGGFYQEFYGTGATTRQFVEYVKKRSAVALDKLFDEWLFTPKAAELILSGESLSQIVERYR